VIINVTHSNLLGNALFNHACLLGAAAESDTRYAFPTFGDYTALFPALDRDPFVAGLPPVLPAPVARWIRSATVPLVTRAGRYAIRREAAGRPLRGVRTFASGWHTTLRITDGVATSVADGVVHVDRDPFAAAVRAGGVVVVSGPLFRFADPDRWREHRERIVETFRFSDAVVDRAVATTARARGDHDRLIGIHVRRGDYAGFLGGRFCYPWSAYADLMTAVAAAWGAGAAFLVCSDESIPADFDPPVPWSPGAGDVATDLASLARCDLVLGPPSTFSAWASFTGRVPRHVVLDPAHVPTPDEFSVYSGFD